MHPEFDDIDRGIVIERQRNRFTLSGPQVGDYIERRDGKRTRITQLYDDRAQIGTAWSESGDSGSFHFNGSGTMSYSGGLDAAIPFTHLREKTGLQKARAWIFHHGTMQAHNGVDCEVLVRTWRLLEDNEAIKVSGPQRYIIDGKKPFTGTIKNHTYTTFDDIERVAYTDNKPLELYMAENPGNIVVDDIAMDRLMDAHYASLKTAPVEISAERYEEMLGVLPPSKWQTIDGASIFHISERITGNLVSWFIAKGDQHFTFVDEASLSNAELSKHIAAAGV